MEGLSFDRVIRTLAGGISRRALLPWLVSAAAGATVATAALQPASSDPKGPKRPKGGGKGKGGGHGKGRGGAGTTAAPSTGPACVGSCAQPQSPTVWQAEIRTGSCASPGPLAAALQPPTIPTGPVQGAPEAITGATSFTPAPMPLARLLATPHVVTIAHADAIVACGAIGGVVGPDGSLTVVLHPRDGRASTAVAFIAATGSVSLFLDPGPAEAATPAASPAAGVARLPTVAPTASPSPSSSPTPIR